MYYIARCMDCGQMVAYINESALWDDVIAFINMWHYEGFEVVRLGKRDFDKLTLADCTCIPVVQLQLL